MIFTSPTTLVVQTGDAGNPALAADPGFAGRQGAAHRAADHGRPGTADDRADRAWARAAACASIPSDGSLYITDRTPTADRLQRITKDSEVSTVWTWPDKPGVAGCAAMDGTVLVNLVNTKQTVAVRLAPATGAVTGEPEVVRQDQHGHAWALRMSPDGNVWGATVNKTAGDADKLDDVVFPLFPQGGGFPRSNATRPGRRMRRTLRSGPQAASTSSRTRAASAWPLVAFITAPTIAPGRGHLSAANLLCHIGIGGQRLVDGGLGQRVVAHQRQTARGHHLLGFALPGQHALDDLAGQLVGQLALVDQRDHRGDLGGADGQLVQFDAGLVGLLHQEVSPPGACRLRWRRRAATVAVTRFDRAGVDEVAHHLVGDTPVLLNSLAAQPR